MLRKLCKESWTKRPLYDLTFEMVNEWQQRKGVEVTDNTIRTDIAFSVKKFCVSFHSLFDLAMPRLEALGLGEIISPFFAAPPKFSS